MTERRPTPRSRQPVHIGLTTTVISKAARADTTRPSTMLDLQGAGLNPILIVSTYDGPTPAAEVRRLGLIAAEHARDRNGTTDLLFCEDDITIVDEDLLHYQLSAARAARRITTLCALNPRHYPAETWHENQPIRARLERLPDATAPTGRQGGFHGSQALYLPRAVVQHIVDNPFDFQRVDGQPLDGPMARTESDYRHQLITGFDMWIKDKAIRYGGIFAAIPSPIDHLGDNPARERWRNPTAGWKWRP